MSKYPVLKPLIYTAAVCIFMTAACIRTRPDKSASGSCELPEILRSEDGTVIETDRQWQSLRKPEILELFREQVYGRAPEAEPDISYVVRKEDRHALCGKARMKEVEMRICTEGDTLKACLLVYLPGDGKPGASSSPVPVFVGLNFYGNHSVHVDENISITGSYVNNNPELCIFENRATEESRGGRAWRWPVERILERGYGLATLYYGDLDPDFHDGFHNGLHGLLDPSPRDSSSWGAIAAWAWGLSRAMDYFEKDPEIDHHRIALMGHSRLGKTALWAAALDERFAMVISNESGCGGAALSRRKSGERLLDINTNFPHWFTARFHFFNQREEDLPVDQHMLLALIAPRPLYISSAANDKWADPEGEYLSLFHAAEVYRLYGFEGPDNIELPEINRPLHLERLAYHIRSGDHNVTRYDWERFMDFADKQLK